MVDYVYMLIYGDLGSLLDYGTELDPRSHQERGELQSYSDLGSLDEESPVVGGCERR